jgi:hypothetical protein
MVFCHAFFATDFTDLMDFPSFDFKFFSQILQIKQIFNF